MIDDRYEVTKDGKVYKVSTGRELKADTSNGYARITIVGLDGNRKKYSIHRLVANKFVANPDMKPMVNHIDGNKVNNHYSNLEWVTNEENIIHARDVLGNSFKYDNCAKKVVDENGNEYVSVKDAARKLGVATKTIRKRYFG